MDQHLGFIAAAYAIAFAVIASMIVVIVADNWSLKRSLKRFGARDGERS